MYLPYVICIDPKFFEVIKFCDVWFTLNYRNVKIEASNSQANSQQFTTYTIRHATRAPS